VAEKPPILVVEDDPRIAQFLSWNLQRLGHRVTIAADGLAALQAFDAAPPALVTLDLTLPGVSGFRLIRLFKRNRPYIPVLVVSGMSYEEAEDAVRAGADEFLTKPIEFATLRAKVSYHLRRSAAAALSPAPPPDRRPLLIGA
jgi:DNA-binding response OmpR family regulator